MVERLAVVVPARVDSVRFVRRRVASWLADRGWAADDSERLVFAVSEVVTNSIEHGYGVTEPDEEHVGRVKVRAQTGETSGHRQVRITVADTGRWLEPTPCRCGRGYGLPVIRNLVDEVRVRNMACGTVVTMVSRECLR